MKKNKWALGLIAAALLTVVSIGAGFAGDWAGKYATEDTKGNAFTIDLNKDATARGEKQGHVLEGTWSTDGDSATIKWTTGWTTKLTMDGDAYKKTAFRPGAAITDEGAKATPAEKVD